MSGAPMFWWIYGHSGHNHPDLCERSFDLEYRDEQARILNGLQSGRLEFNAEAYACVYNAADQNNCAAILDCEQRNVWTPKVAEVARVNGTTNAGRRQ